MSYRFDATVWDGKRRWPHGAWEWNSAMPVSHFDLTMLRGLARYLIANHNPTKALIGDISRYSVGAGLEAFAASGDDAWDAAANEFFAWWAAVCDITGRLHFHDIQRLACEAMSGDGEAFVLKELGRNGFPFLKFLKAHAIGAAGAPDEKDPAFVNGVWLSKHERATHYRVLLADGEHYDAPAPTVLHLAEVSDPDAWRHITPLAASIADLLDLKETTGHEKLAVKIHAAIAAVLKGKGMDSAEKVFGAGGFGDDDDEDAAPPAPAPAKEVTVDNMLSGTIPTLGDGQELQTWENRRAGGPIFGPYSEFILRGHCAAEGVPIEFLWNPQTVGGAPARFVVAKAGRRFAIRQSYLNRALVAPCWRYAIAWAIKTKRLPLTQHWRRCIVQGPALVTVDAGRESANDRADLAAGLTTMAELYGERGIRQWANHVTQWAREKRYQIDELARQGLTLEQAAQLDAIAMARGESDRISLNHQIRSPY
ncbi:hypothetical protein DB346_02375 [Verrucomicrobia bacterium LW23]|nr:hypothetical protein DB346_02375 [Verrucomicrobia bacterium LW23]